MPLQALRAWLARLETWRASLQEPEPAEPEELEPAELGRIRLTAELAADWLCGGSIARVNNPWPRGTRQWILWETSYQAQVLQHEFADTSPDALMSDADTKQEAEACFAG